MFCSAFYPQAVSFGAEALVSMKRIEEYLSKPEKDESMRRVLRKEAEEDKGRYFDGKFLNFSSTNSGSFQITQSSSTT